MNYKYPFYFSCIFSICIVFSGLNVYCLDNIPETPGSWTEKGVVLTAGISDQWDERGAAVVGIAKKSGKYYLFYLGAFYGCWTSGANHKSLGVATGTDGVNFTKYSDNPLLIPHDFVPVESHEESIRAAIIDYIPAISKFVGYFGVEDPGGSNTCGFMASSGCGCDIEVDSFIYAATSDDGINWAIAGEVSGAYNENGAENYPSTFEYYNGVFYLWNHRAQGGQIFHASRGADYKNLTKLGTIPELDFGWSTAETFLHNDGNTVTLMYVPNGNGYDGSELRFATSTMSNMTTVSNVRAWKGNVHSANNAILKDEETGEWRWYYSTAKNTYLRTAPISTPPESPTKLRITD